MREQRGPCATVVGIVLALACTGCINLRPADPAPVVFQQTPTLETVIAAVNGNSAPIRTLQTQGAKLSIKGAPELEADLAMQPPRNVRLRADFMGLGQVFDFGSNGEMFWALIDAPEMATNVPRGVYFARHDQFQRSTMGQFLPIKPDWLIDAFGVVHLDPRGVHEGPYAHAPGKMQIRSHLPTPDGQVLRIMVLDDKHGWVLEQYLYDPQGRLIVSSNASNYRYYPQAGVSLPHRVSVQLPPPANSFYIDVRSYLINQLQSDPMQLWKMPAYQGYPKYDLAASPPAQPPLSPPPSNSGYGPAGTYPTTGYRPNYRGYPSVR